MPISEPAISACIPVYNRSSALRSTVISVLQQTFGDFELILVDDGSTDDTPDIIAEFSDRRLRYLHQENQGQAAARNRGLAEARAPVIAFLDHDDRWAPEKLALQYATLEAHPEWCLVYGRLDFVDEEGLPVAGASEAGPTGDVYEQLLLHHNFVRTMSNPLMRSEVIRQVGGFSSDAGMSDDWDLFLRMARIGSFGFIDKVLVHYNVGNERSQTRDVPRSFESEAALLRRYFREDPNLSPAFRRAVLADFRKRFAPGFREYGWHALRARQLSRAWRSYARALQLCPGYLVNRQVLADLRTLVRATLWERHGHGS